MSLPTGSGLDPVHLERLRGYARLLESAFRIPGTRWRVGVDALAGLIPGLGDIMGGILSSVIISEAVRAGVPRPVLLRMFLNVAVDVVAGAIPVFGDAFDIFWKPALRNLALLERYHERPDRTAAATRRGLLLLALGIGLVAASGMALAVASVFWIWRWLFGG
jgi:hypothetical protein